MMLVGGLIAHFWSRPEGVKYHLLSDGSANSLSDSSLYSVEGTDWFSLLCLPRGNDTPVV